MKLLHQVNQPLMKKHILIIALGSILGLITYYYLSSSDLNESSQTTLAFLMSGVCGVLLAYLTYFISRNLDTVMPWKSQLASRFLSGILINFVIAFITVTLSLILFNIFVIIELDFFDTHESLLIKLGIILFILMLIYNIIYFALYSYYTYATLQIESVKYERKHIDLQLKALKSQLSSHFLFNNLNTISSLSFQDAKTAESYVRGLVKIYEYTLNSYHSKLVLLYDELEFVNSYLKLIQTRYGKIFNYKIEIPNAIKTTQIPPLTLQMLVENAVKHNQMDIKNPLSISLLMVGNYIVVKNNITKIPHKISSFKIGLNNIDSRYKLLINKGIEIIKDNNFIVKIPVIQ